MTSDVVGVRIQTKHKAIHHCGIVELELDLPVSDGINPESDLELSEHPLT